ncbi:MAG: hypothetical protein HOJ87_03655 [Rhodospirillaceae bacterium]|jgi:hypothetical protein|nr:hypothetical protein [Rhodospirillaceae bacterium]
MRAMLTILLMTAATASAAVYIWQADVPDATRSLALCERLRHLEFDQKTTRWIELGTPIKTVVVCDIPGTTSDLKVEGLIEPYIDTPLAKQTISVDCFKAARIRSGAPAIQMPDGFYCNIPDVVR